METTNVKSDHSYGGRDEPTHGSGGTADAIGISGHNRDLGEADTDIKLELTCDISDEQEIVTADTNVKDAATGNGGTWSKDVCPFVCGICSMKFSKISPFYSHLNTHKKFDHFSQLTEKNKILGALNVKEKVDENIFKCGICKVEFPSMSLLHYHMVAEENIADYNYSNVDHTARPDTSKLKVQNDSSNLIEGGTTLRNMRTRNNKSDGKTKGKEAENLRNDKNVRSIRKTSGGVYESNKANNDFEQEQLMKTRLGGKRKYKGSNSADEMPNTKAGGKSRIKEKELEIKNSSRLKVQESTDIHTYGSRGSAGPATRSSRRCDSRLSKRVDYKALAGISSPPKYEENVVEKQVKAQGTKRTKKENDTSEEKKQKEYVISDQGSNLKTNTTEMRKLSDKNVVKVVSREKIKVYKIEARKAESVSEKDVVLKDENTDDGKPANKKESSAAVENNEIVDNKILNEEIAKTDGTLIEKVIDDIISDDGEVSDEYNVSSHDSDDDYRDEVNLDETDKAEKDSDFDPLPETIDDGVDDNIVSLTNTRDPDQYLNKFKVKRKRIYNSTSGQLIKNCLYPCIVCGRYYSWKALKKHMYAHIKAKVVKCEQCGKSYKSKRHLNDHVRSVHSMKKYRCTVCCNVLKGNQSFEKHMMMHILKKEVTVALDEIEKIEVTEEEYRQWKGTQDIDNTNKPSKRDYKKKEAKDKDSNNENVIDIDFLQGGVIHGEEIDLDNDIVGTTKNRICKICKKRFFTHDSLVKHMLVHKDERHFSCETCNAFFQTLEHLQNHTQTVHGEQDLICNICGEGMRSQYALWSHKGKHLMKKDKYYSEEVVQKLQDEITERTKRPRNKNFPQSLECEICGMVMMYSRYKRHLEVHNTTTEWECDICHKQYKTRRYLIDHKQKTHFAERVTCHICGLSFKGKTYLEIHKQIHGPKDKQCPHCGKGFTTLMYMKTHLQTHDHRKRFRCEECTAAFSHKQRLTIHMVEVHGQGASRPCKYCGDLFSSRQKARTHERIVHEGFVKPAKPKKESSFVNIVKISEDSSVSLENRIVSMMPHGYGTVAMTPAAVKVSAQTNMPAQHGRKTSTDHDDSVSSAKDGQFIKLENGEEYQVMIEKDGTCSGESLEFVELTEEEQNVIIEEAASDGLMSHAGPVLEHGNENVEQILEIPENAEQCQILLYPDGTFKLLNVVDKTN